MNLKVKGLIAWIVITLLTLACAISFGGEELSENERLQTAVAQTVAAQQQVSPQTPQPDQALPTITPAPTNTVQNSPTANPKPCNKGFLVNESPQDNAKFNVGEDFDKRWRIRNDGTCTWNTSYRLVFADGSKMGGPSSQNLTQNVAPGESVDIIIDLTAPNLAGTYRGNWQLLDDDGVVFFSPYVIIEAQAILAPPIALPDLVTQNFSIEPATPTMGANTHVKVRVKNQGGMDSGAFTVKWYGLDSFANPSCTWNVDNLGVGANKWLECDFVFSSWYPINKTSVVYLDTGNTVNEINEGNNSKTISPFGVNP